MGVEQHRRPRRLAGPHADHAAQIVGGHLVVTQHGHLAHHQLGNVALLPREAGPTDEFAGKGEGLGRVGDLHGFTPEAWL